MKLALTLLPALAGLTVAEEVVSMLLWAVDRDQDYEASIVGHDATATTYSLACPTSVRGSACSIGGAGITAEIVDQSTSTTWACTADGTTEGVCHRTLSGQDQGIDIYFTNFLSATVTAGAVTGGSGRVSETASATSTTLAHASLSTEMASASQELTSSDITSAPTATASADGNGDAAATKTSTGGVPRMTGGAGLVFGGAAVALMGAII
ncbi:uncharacterized protein BO72DRAFT_492005 [Aspergillus fijiensis CBS 313.89]|uniref:GPI anchored protein n=1 Tax=Aspergillus fijiensis CBS 313.89 TaxID=1448319 RepID=A0A8G1S1P3_9EURO|nr:uncharacterized protein BO72DRAFT_492005 [Aspergillus fijiensis CBS 313.89]RAK81776.1 hypothetical protein BO72DRAFT_492005 [Aspergillus fijiensis CBS 313.89]